MAAQNWMPLLSSEAIKVFAPSKISKKGSEFKQSLAPILSKVSKRTTAEDTSSIRKISSSSVVLVMLPAIKVEPVIIVLASAWANTLLGSVSCKSSKAQSEEQPSFETVLASSQPSLPSSTPLPQTGKVHADVLKTHKLSQESAPPAKPREAQ